MVVQTCHVVFWNQHVKLHLTMRSKGQRSNREIYAYFARYVLQKKILIKYDRALHAL